MAQLGDVNLYSLERPIVADQTQYHEVNIKTLNVVDACERLEGVYSMVIVDKFVAVNDPYGFRLLVMGRKLDLTLKIVKRNSGFED